jgi:hypothetical protein
MSKSLTATVKSSYARSARGAGRALTRLGVMGSQAPPRDHRVRHWAYSLTRAHDSLAIAELDVPWWTYGAIDAVESWLRTRPSPTRVFEWGSGASTIWLARRAASVVTVEHHAGFAATIAPALAGHANVTAVVVEPQPMAPPLIGSAKEGHAGLDFSRYVAEIDAHPGTFDLVVVDGRAREACLPRALPRLADDGLVVFDNSRRSRYRRAIAAAGVVEQRYAGLTPTLPYPDQTSLLRRRAAA